MDLEGLVDAATARRVASGPGARRLQAGTLEAGDVGVLEVEVRAAQPVKTFTRRDGKEGMLRRVTLGDRSGEVDLVLWGDEVHQVTDGPFTPRAHVRLRGATIKAGFRDGVEVHLGGAVVEPMVTPVETLVLEGVLESVGDTKVSGAPPHVRFHCDCALVTSRGRIQVLLWDGLVKQARSVLPGATVRIDGATAHPALEGWFVAEGAAFHVR